MTANLFFGIERSFSIAFVPRCGSNAVCDLLTRNGLGAPAEFFQGFSGRTGSLDDLQSIIKMQSRNAIFGAKFGHDHRAGLEALLRRSFGIGRIHELWPNHIWVWIKRRDRIRQAISLCQAELTGEWLKLDINPSTDVTWEYDYFHILSRLMIVMVSEHCWSNYFTRIRIDPLVIYYEDFFSDVQTNLKALVEHLGGMPRGHAGQSLLTETSLKIQANDVTAEWFERFCSDLDRVGDPEFAIENREALPFWVSFFSDRKWRRL